MAILERVTSAESGHYREGLLLIRSTFMQHTHSASVVLQDSITNDSLGLLYVGMPLSGTEREVYYYQVQPNLSGLHELRCFEAEN